MGYLGTVLILTIPDIMAIEMSWPIGYPMVRKLDTDLWEVRTGISDKRICRIMFTVSGNTMILLDLFDNCVVEAETKYQ